MTIPRNPEASPWYADGSDKVCTKCHRLLPESTFSFKYKSLNLLHTHCNSCQRPMRQASYQKNRTYYLDQITKRQQELLLRLDELKSGLACSRYGFAHPAAIQFHHRDPNQKDVEISAAVRNGWGKTRLLREIEKCDILCVNCHFILHWEQRKRVGEAPAVYRALESYAAS